MCFYSVLQYHREGDDDNHDDSGDFNFNVTMETQEPDAAQGASFLDNDGTLLAGDNLVEQPRKVGKKQNNKNALKLLCKQLCHLMKINLAENSTIINAFIILVNCYKEECSPKF